ncbi:SusD family protein [compost metagenome]
MKPIKYFFIIFIGLFSSCQKILDTKPSNFISPDQFYQTPEQLQAGLNGIYSSLASPKVYKDNYLYMFNTNTDESYGRMIDLVTSYQYDAAEPKVEMFWEGLYHGIERANLLLANIDKVSMDQTHKNIIKGQALFLRSFQYFMLVSNFGDVPLITKPTSSVVKVNIARTPMKEVYDQITKDMITAEELLKTQTASALGSGGRVTRTAVQGMLARVYLYMAGFPLNDREKYKDALFWAKKVVHPTENAPEHALNPDYRQVFINYAQDKYDVKESMWELEFWGNNTGGINLGNTYTGRFCGILCYDLQKGYSLAYVNATKKLFDSYEINPLSTGTTNKASYDRRRDWNCANYTWGTGVTAAKINVTNTWLMNAGKWRREYEVVDPQDKNYTSQNFAFLRYADVLLMLAEAENEVNGPNNAYQYVNMVRKRAYGILHGNVVKHIAITNGGSGYSSANPPTISITGGGGSGATAEAVVSTAGVVTGVIITSPGTLTTSGPYYTSAPTVTFTSTAGSGAQATATITQSTDADLTSLQISEKRFLLEAIKEERSRELCFEALRRNDLIRWGNFVDDMKDFLSYANANSGTAINITTAASKVSQRNVFMPIPIRDIQLNNLLVQNTGY